MRVLALLLGGFGLVGDRLLGGPVHLIGFRSYHLIAFKRCTGIAFESLGDGQIDVQPATPSTLNVNMRMANTKSELYAYTVQVFASQSGATLFFVSGSFPSTSIHFYLSSQSCG